MPPFLDFTKRWLPFFDRPQCVVQRSPRSHLVGLPSHPPAGRLVRQQNCGAAARLTLPDAPGARTKLNHFVLAIFRPIADVPVNERIQLSQLASLEIQASVR
ncbi:hypothetical protein, partial [Burkholderia sp. ABCPW 14]|uniref:hypothetical protein n=1 Tax=Burkholderia sp. ABCPW 14 TaxID=1637860 RepID=UPI000A98ECA2